MANRRKLTRELLAKHPHCCFCGGGITATTADHVPAKILFWGKRRPGGLELPACKPCNCGTRQLEQAAGIFSRMRMEELLPNEEAELRRLRENVDQSFPGWRKELYPSDEQIALAQKQLGQMADTVRTVNMGPLVTEALCAVVAKLGFGLHYRHSGHIVPKGGVVEVRFDTNATMIDRPFPKAVLESLGPMEHLCQGSWTSRLHFGYRGAWTSDGRGSIFIGHLGKAIGFTSIIFSREDDTTESNGFRRFRPGDLQRADSEARRRYAAALPISAIKGSAHATLGFSLPGEKK